MSRLCISSSCTLASAENWRRVRRLNSDLESPSMVHSVSRIRSLLTKGSKPSLLAFWSELGHQCFGLEGQRRVRAVNVW